jgi:feruloyl-CoA synthase
MRADGTTILRSPQALKPYARAVGDWLVHWYERAPDRTFIAERKGDGWRRVSYRDTLSDARRIGQALLNLGLGPDRPVAILSDNSVDHALLALGAMHVGVPVAPISPAYSLVSKDYAKLKYIFELLKPGLVFAAEPEKFAPALAAVGATSTPVSRLLETNPGSTLEVAFSRLTPDTVAKILFTSGSTSLPKGVINTQRMLCSNQQSIAQVWPFLEDRPPVMLDWLPWNHTFGGNKTFNMMLRNGGTLYIDSGKPVPGQIERTVENLRDVSPTISFNIPRGYDALLPFLEGDAALSDSFFRNMDMVFYAAASLPQNVWERLERLAVRVRGEPVFMASGWGATETSPCITMVHYPIQRAGVIGLPMPGVELKMLPNEGKLELRVKGPCVFPGYFRQEDLTRQSFDEEGFYRIGDAGKLLDAADPSKGLVFDGRVSEDFKLTTGTWVQVGGLRLGALEAAAPFLQDAVVTGHDRDFIGLLAWLNVEACRREAGLDSDDAAVLVASPSVVEQVRRLLQRRNEAQTGSSSRIARVILMAEPPSLDANEITDKGYINQRVALDNRAAQVTRLFDGVAHPDMVVIG